MMRILETIGVSPNVAGGPGKIRQVLAAVFAGIVGVALMLSLTGCTLWTVRSLHPATGAAGGASAEPGKPGFSPAAYADSIWQSKVLPTVHEQAVDLPTLLAALKADPEGAKQKYGHHEGQRPYNFLVKGEGKVLTVDTSSRTGKANVDLAPGDGKPDAAIQVGPVIRGTSLRDALPFIQFNLFTNQIEYADVSNQLNDHVIKDAIGDLDVPGLQGKTLTFEGAFTLDPTGDVLVTPVKLEAK
jgi:predicted lipoprotein